MIRFSTALRASSSRTINCLFSLSRSYRSRPKNIVSESSLPQLSKEDELRIDMGIRKLKQSRRIPYSSRRFEPEPQEEVQSVPIKNEPPPNPSQQSKSVLKDVQIDPSGLSEQDIQRFNMMKENAPSSSDLKKMNMNTLMKDMGLSKSDQEFLMNNINQPNPSDPLSRLERILSQDSSIMPLLENWQKEVEQALGKGVDNPLSLTKEDITRIPPAPEKLQNVIKYMFSNEK